MRTKDFSHVMTYTMLAAFGLLAAGVGYVAYQTTLPTKEVAALKTETQTSAAAATESGWESLYPEVTPMQIGSSTVFASVAKTWPDRIKGLSDTPYLPDEVVKFFVFDSLGLHSIWMKNMNYSLDIIWLDEAGSIVHIVEGAAPESFPAMFVPDSPAMYVVEAVEGFVKKNEITKGSTVTLPKI